MFTGIPFGNDDYQYEEAKRLLHVVMIELRKQSDLRKVGMDPAGKGRRNINDGAERGVRDFLPFVEARSAKFNEFPHLTLTLRPERLRAMVTIPNGIRSVFRRNLLAGGKDGFHHLLEDVHGNLSRTFRGINGVVHRAPFSRLKIQYAWRKQRTS